MSFSQKVGAIVLAIIIVLATGGLTYGLIANSAPQRVKVSTVEEFIKEAKHRRNSNSKTIILKNDIDFSDVDFTPIRLYANIEGNGHKLSNITITSTSDGNVGIFSAASPYHRQKKMHLLVIRDLTVENLTVNYNGLGENVGGLFGDATYASLENVSVEGVVNANAATNVGGIFGTIDTIERVVPSFSNVTSNVTVSGMANVGGIGGCVSNEGVQITITGCTNNGEVSAVKDHAAGIVGFYDGGHVNSTEDKIVNCTNNAEIKTKRYGAGIVSEGLSVSLENCKNNGEVSAFGGVEMNYIGGIAGKVTDCSIGFCENTARIWGEMSVGGIAGHVLIDSGKEHSLGKNFASNKNTGLVHGKEFVGGNFGKFTGGYALITVSENSGKVEGQTRVGGIIGGMEKCTTSVITYCTNKGNITSGNAYGAVLIGSINIKIWQDMDMSKMDTNVNSGLLNGSESNVLYNWEV